MRKQTEKWWKRQLSLLSAELGGIKPGNKKGGRLPSVKKCPANERVKGTHG